ncbi:MAG: hypothetical protein LRZ85_02275 [Alphaproteobacteria bacterium]|nr:hypothetical protein [Alphaproteobacteria bacterium]
MSSDSSIEDQQDDDQDAPVQEAEGEAKAKEKAAEESKKVEPPKPDDSRKQSSPIVDLAGTVQINSANRLPHLDNGVIKAYQASSEKKA